MPSNPKAASQSREDMVRPRIDVAHPRLDSVDLLRGLVMVLMALDHTRGFFSNITFNPLDLTQTNPVLFFTRWFTHYCAPTFVFLAGTGAFLSTTRGKTRSELSWFLLTRGLWLVFLEVTVIRWFGWMFNFDLHSVGTGVIWAIGWSMVVLAGLVFLPIRYIGLLGLVMIAGHNAFDFVQPADWGRFRWLWAILHQAEKTEVLPGYNLTTGYPLIPWIGVMAAGYAFGTILLRAPSERRKWLLSLGATASLLFVLIRYSNLYGDPNPWVPQNHGMLTLFSFIDCFKYPPSLLYLLMTLGPALVVMSLLDRGTPRFLKPALVFGRVPLFYYVLHLALIHGLAVSFAFVRYGRADGLYGSSPGPRPDGYGYGLPVVYAVWILVVLILYPLCRWFADLKRRRRDPWLSYL